MVGSSLALSEGLQVFDLIEKFIQILFLARKNNIEVAVIKVDIFRVVAVL